MALELCLDPGEFLDDRFGELLPRVSGKKWSVLPHPRDRGSGSKTGEYDSSVSLDRSRHEPLRAALAGLKPGRPAHEKVANTDYPEAARVFAAAVKKSGLSRLSPTLYSLRH